MPKTEHDPLGPEFSRRLRGELDRVQPRFSPPRYLSASGRPVTWRLAPAILGVSLVGILALSLFAATGSPNPIVWSERVVTVIHPNAATPTPSPTPQDHRGAPAATPSQKDNRPSSPEPSERPEPTKQSEPTEQPEPTEGPEPAESPEATDSHSGDSSQDRSGSGSSGGRDSGSD